MKGNPRQDFLQAAAVGTSPEGGPVTNERGIIAESYHDLQGLAVLAAARATYPLPKASPESTLRAVFQAAEVALLNLADLSTRATGDVRRGNIGGASVKMFWARGFHRVLVRLSMIPHQLGLTVKGGSVRGTLRVAESPAFGEYFTALGEFDREVLSRIETGDLPLDTTVGERSLESAEFNLIHLARICNQQSTVWESNLTAVAVSCDVPSYETFVVAGGMRDAVYERVLTGDTYFTQFRGLHQIPEILGEEVNDRLEEAIRALRVGRLHDAAEHLGCVNTLFESILASLPSIVDNLATADYHEIRENLGLTSGSHSVCLRFHMFTHLYSQLWEELSGRLRGWLVPEHDAPDIETVVREIDRDRSRNPDAWLARLVCDECLKLRVFIFQWRDEHLNLPRNNLGGDFTKSLTGSHDAVQAVRHMRDAARTSDPMLPLARARALTSPGHNPHPGKLTRYLESDSSLDTEILSTTGKVTQKRFQDVQDRLGYFANRCPFTPPPRRRA